MKNLVVAILFLCGALGSSQWQDKYVAERLVQGQDTLSYRILYPKDFDRDQKYPLVLFLHGAGERGSDNAGQLVHGGELFAMDSLQQRYPAVVIFPQCPKTDYWAQVAVDRQQSPLGLEFQYGAGPTKALEMVMRLLENTLAESYADPDRVYLMGLSMGGMGTFELLARKPETFAAAIPICGGGDPGTVSAYAKKTALWAIHGAQDDVVDPGHSLEMVSALLKAGAHPRFSLYEFANHNSWDPAFADPGLLPWLFAHTRGEP